MSPAILGIHIDDIEEGTTFAPAFSINLENDTIVDYSNHRFDWVPKGGLQERKNVKSCALGVASVASAFASGASAAAAWYAVFHKAAGEAKYESDNKNCGVHHHVVDTPSRKMRYVYSSSGGDCSSTAQESTIEGSLDKAYRTYIKSHYDHIWCMELTHGGTWKGYLLIGPDGNWPSNLSCGDSSSGTCVSGGKNDDHT